jgi:hypothetical protein
MASRKTKKPRVNPTPQPFRQPTADTEVLGLSLPPAVSRRLAILTEDSDLETVLSEAVQRLWNQRYPRQRSLALPTPTAGAPAKASLASEGKGAMSPNVAELEAIPPAAVARAAEPSAETSPATTAADEERGTTTPATDRQAIVEQVQAWHADGLSLTAIAARLNRENVPTLSGSGQWRHGTIKRLLRASAASAANT